MLDTKPSAKATAVRVNDFVVKFANVNGSGSASANGLFAKAILRMGVPVSARNIFPSNIQGLPTWYEVRVSEAGFRDVVYYPYGFLADNAESQLEGQLAAAGRPELTVRFVPCLNGSPSLAEEIATQVVAAASLRLRATILPRFGGVSTTEARMTLNAR